MVDTQLWITCKWAKLETGCGGPYPTGLRCLQTKQDTFWSSVCTPDIQWQGHTTHQCPAPSLLFYKSLQLLVGACRRLGGHRPEETATSSGASTKTTADRRSDQVRREAGCEWVGAVEGTTKASAGTLALACRYVGWPWIKCSLSIPVDRLEADPSSGWEAQLAVDGEPLVEDQHRPSQEPWLQLMKEKSGKQWIKQNQIKCSVLK